jgi:outer membrane protein
LDSVLKISRMLSAAAAIVAVAAQVSLAHAESIHEALAKAYSNNPTLRAERAGLRAADEQVSQALSGWRPTVSAQASAAYEWSEQSTRFVGVPPGITAESAPASLSIRLSQPIFQGFRTVEGVKAAEARVRAGRQQLLSVEQEILFRAVQAYMNVIRDRKILSLRRQNVTILNEQLSAAKARFAAGEITKTDVSQANARLSQAKAAVSSAIAQLEASVASYHAVIGHKPKELHSPKGPRLPRNLDSALSIAHETNPNILAAAQVEDAALHDIAVARAGLLPELSLNASASISEDWEVKSGNREAASIEGRLDIPIYDGGRTYSEVRRTKQVASQRRIQIIEATRQVRESVTSSWNFQLSARQNISSAKTQVTAAQDALNGVREEYIVGSRSTLDVLNAQQELLNARISLVQTERDYIVAVYQVLGSMGKLTARHLGLRVSIYDPKENYNRVRNQLFGAGVETVK